MIRLQLYLLSLLWIAPSFAQSDSTLTRQFLEMQATIDSLQKRLIKLERELQSIKQNQPRSELDQLLITLDEEDAQTPPEDQRSRRKRVDALLKAITEQPGKLRFNGGATSTLQSNAGETDAFVTGVASFDIFAHTSFGENTLLFIDLEAIGGNGPNSRIPTFASLNEDAGSTQSRDGLDRLTVLEAWAEFTAFEEAIKLTMGKIDLTNYFDNNSFANDETSQFISGAFVNSAAFPVPNNSAGVRFITTILNRFSLQIGAASSDNSGADLLTDIFKMASVGFKVFPDSPWEANLRLYSYAHPSAGDDLGYGVSFDESIAEAFSIFARYTTNGHELANWFGVKSAWSAGARFVRQIEGRRNVAGVAYGQISPADDALANERIAELYVRHPINNWVNISPHVQVVWNPGGEGGRHTLVGLRTHFNF